MTRYKLTFVDFLDILGPPNNKGYNFEGETTSIDTSRKPEFPSDGIHGLPIYKMLKSCEERGVPLRPGDVLEHEKGFSFRIDEIEGYMTTRIPEPKSRLPDKVK